jgi:hypothetical protein
VTLTDNRCWLMSWQRMILLLLIRHAAALERKQPNWRGPNFRAS